jgi:carbon monoxide dehydrogenase subunit G
VRTEKRVGDSFRIIYKVLGVTFDEKFKVTEYQRPSRLRTTFDGGMKGTFAWSFAPEGSKARLNVDIDYQLAGGPVGKAIDAALLHRTNEKTIEQQLQNLQKAIAKGAVSTP